MIQENIEKICVTNLRQRGAKSHGRTGEAGGGAGESCLFQ